jgi:hypothetical protein
MDKNEFFQKVFRKTGVRESVASRAQWGAGSAGGPHSQGGPEIPHIKMPAVDDALRPILSQLNDSPVATNETMECENGVQG